MAKDLNRSIKIYIDSSDAMKKSKDLETRMSKLRDRLQELHAQGKKDTPEYARTEKALQQLSTSYGRYQEKLKETERILKNLSGATEAELLSVRNQLRQDLKKTTRDTDEYKAKLEALTAVEKELANVTREMQGEMGSQATMWDRASSKLNGLKVAVVGFLSSIILDKAVNDFATLDDKFADVMKTTGQTREKVVAMNEEFKKIDTRTTTTGLNDIAEEAGRIGIAKDEVLDFVKAMDIANVALGDSFSGGASEIANTLGKLKFLFKETQEMGVEKAYLSIASAINELGANGVASEVNIANFTTRIGSMPAALKPSIADTLALGAAFEESGIEAEVASRAYSIMLQKASTDTAGFARVMKISKQEVENLINTNPVEFFLKFSESMKGMSATDTSKTLKELKVNADGVNKVIGAASENADRFRELLDLSNASFKEGTSVINEFNIKNNTFGAQLDKSKKILQDYIYELGSRLAPIVKDGLVAGGSLIKILSTITGFLFDNGKAILTVVGAIAAYNAGLKLTIYWETINNSLQAISKMRLAEKALAQALSTGNTTRAAAAERLYAASMTQSNAAARAYTSVVSLLSAAKYLLTGNITKARQALIAFQVVSKLNPAGLMTTAVLGLVAAFGYLLYKTNQVVTAQKAIKKATEELNGELAREQSEANKLFEALKRTNPQSEERKKLTEQIIEKYGPYLKGLVDEKGNLIDIARAQELVNTKIREGIALKIKNAATDTIQTDGIKNQIKEVEEVVSMLQKQLGSSFSTEAANVVRENIHKAIDKSIAEGKTGVVELTNAIKEVVDKESPDLNEKFGFWDPKSIYLQTASIASRVYQTQEELKKVEDQFKGIISDATQLSSIIGDDGSSVDGTDFTPTVSGDTKASKQKKALDLLLENLETKHQERLLEIKKKYQSDEIESESGYKAQLFVQEQSYYTLREHLLVEFLKKVSDKELKSDISKQIADLRVKQLDDAIKHKEALEKIILDANPEEKEKIAYENRLRDLKLFGASKEELQMKIALAETENERNALQKKYDAFVLLEQQHQDNLVKIRKDAKAKLKAAGEEKFEEEFADRKAQLQQKIAEEEQALVFNKGMGIISDEQAYNTEVALQRKRIELLKEEAQARDSLGIKSQRVINDLQKAELGLTNLYVNEYKRRTQQFAQYGESMGSTLGNAIGNQESLLSAFAGSALDILFDVLSQVINAEIAKVTAVGVSAIGQTTANQVASKGFLGIGTAAVLTGVITAAIATAKAALKGLLNNKGGSSSSIGGQSTTTQQRVVSQKASGKYDVIGEQDGKLYRDVPYAGVATTGVVTRPTLMGEQGSELVVSHPDFLALQKHINYPLIVNAIQDVRSGKIPQRAVGKYDELDKSPIPVNNNTVIEPALLKELIITMKELRDKEFDFNIYEFEKWQKKANDARNLGRRR
ncbi:MAG: phage tail tape measure protein [Dysgonomonas sp.]|nr:phage tail tape measure protein [Dysgonomonas sp.]